MTRRYADPVTRSVIVAAVRTPFGRLGGGLASYPATELGALAIREALDRAGLEPQEVEYVIMGQVLQAGVGQAPARQAAVGAASRRRYRRTRSTRSAPRPSARSRSPT